MHTSLLPEERNDARSTLVVAGLRAALKYDAALDAGTGSVPLEVRFGRFAYLRMRQALIDWERKTLGSQAWTTKHPKEFVPFSDELDAGTSTALEDIHADRAQVEA